MGQTRKLVNFIYYLINNDFMFEHAGNIERELADAQSKLDRNLGRLGEILSQDIPELETKVRTNATEALKGLRYTSTKIIVIVRSLNELQTKLGELKVQATRIRKEISDEV